MRHLLIFLVLILLSAGIEIKPVNIESYKNKTIQITVTGEVQNAGTYTLPIYSSVQTALDAANVKDTADLSGINPLLTLNDKDTVFIPSSNTGSIVNEDKVSINASDAETLSTLPGIGVKTAEKIIQYRSQNGLFQSLEELMEVSGIGTAKFDKIKDLIRL